MSFKITTKEGDKIPLNEVDDIEVLREHISKERERHVNTMNIKVKTKNELERIKFLISLIYEMKLFEEGVDMKKNVARKYKEALAIYVMYGYNTKSKEKVKSILNIKKQSDVDNINHKLRELGLIIKDDMNERISHLCDELQVLSRFYLTFKNDREIGLRFLL